MARCDLCDAACRASKLSPLLRQYQTDGIVDVCPKCERWANDTKGAMLEEIPARLREAIAYRRMRFVGRPPRPRWLRWLFPVLGLPGANVNPDPDYPRPPAPTGHKPPMRNPPAPPPAPRNDR